MKPILFSTPMIQAILAGRKTQTRRVVKGTALDWLNNFTQEFILDEGNKFLHKFSIGDILWVRETWRSVEQETGGLRFEYKATEKIDLFHKWKPSIFMPREACRLFLEVTNVKVERLNEISEEDAISEGLEFLEYKNFPSWTYDKIKYPNGFSSAVGCYSHLWESINGEGSWSENPYVWVYDFKVKEVKK